LTFNRHLVFTLLCFFLFASFGTSYITAQESESITIDYISVLGNKRTKTAYILREMTIVPGQQIKRAELDTLLKVNANQVYNTALFNEVLVEPVYKDGGHVDVEVKVRERWYVIPLVYFELSDRSFNVWWKQFDADLSRTKYGAGAEISNMRGRNEELKIDFRRGFTRQYRFRYKFPFINRAKTVGLELRYFYVSHDERHFTIQGNRFQFFDLEAQIDERQEYTVAFTRRKAIKHSQKLQFGVHTFKVAPEIIERNNDFFEDGRTEQRFAEIKYVQQWDNRDITRYPLKGALARFTLHQKGLGIWNDFNQTYLELHGSKYVQVKPNTYLAGNIKAATSFPGNQAFSNRLRVGFESNFIRGYEEFIIEADHFITARTAAKQMVLNTTWKPKWIKWDQFNLIPIKLVLKVYGEGARLWGYDDLENQNSLNGSYLLGTGVGLDIITFHDSLFSLEYSLNRRRERGIFVHFNITWDKE